MTIMTTNLHLSTYSGSQNHHGNVPLGVPIGVPPKLFKRAGQTHAESGRHVPWAAAMGLDTKERLN